MQIPQILSSACTLIIYTLFGNAFVVDSISLRHGGAPKPVIAAVPDTTALVSKAPGDDVKYEVVNKTSIERKDSVDCLCELGTFWHWRIKKCVKQGGWAYECGYFPEEHHHRVCVDGLKCEVLNQSRVKYFHPGAVPASCQSCTPEDNCLMGQERHDADCLKEYELKGKACQTVRVSLMATATAKVTEKVTKTSSATAKATATASEKAKVGGESATKEASAEGKATAEASASGEASAKATATEEGVAEGTACVTVEEVKKLLNLQDVPKIGAVLSSQVVSRGDEEAFDKAYEKALDAAQEAGLINAEQAAKALASAEAQEKAALEAKAKADEAAAWKAEAGANKDAQANAKSKAMAEAQAAASKDAKSAADAAAKAAADAKAAEEAAQAAEKGGGADAAAARKKAEAAKAAAAEAQAKADAAAAKQKAVAKAKAEADAKAKAEAEAAAAVKAQKDALSDVINGRPTDGPARPTTPEPTNPPRKISPEAIAAKLP